MNRIRILIFGLLITLGAGLVVLIMTGQEAPSQLKATMAPIFENLGRPIETVNRSLTRVIPISDLDEQKYGESIALRYEPYADMKSEASSYLNELISRLSHMAVKPFRYRVYVIGTKASAPNAFALPGGIIFVTASLMGILGTDAEAAAILAHEMGHIECSHCVSLIRFRLAAEKIKAARLGEIADFMVNFFLRHAFSKTQESEADEYAFQLLLNSKYDPLGMAEAFSRLLALSGEKGLNRKDVISEYFMTHPYLDLREANYREKATAWWADHPEEKTKRIAKKINFTVHAEF